MRILIFDGAPATWQQGLAEHGAALNPTLFERALVRHRDGLELLALNVADGERLPQGVRITDFDGVVITGSPLNVYKRVPEVVRQIELAREIFEAGVPVWGSCWGLQLMTVALGGEVRRHPGGRELGIARNVTQESDGRGHFLFSGKPVAFDALCSHQDEVTALPDGARVLAGNRHSEVQALEIVRGGASFVGVQYHPEHELATTAAIISARRHRLIEEGLGRQPADFDQLVGDLRSLHADPGRRDAAWRLGLDAMVLDPMLRTMEFANWMEARVAARTADRLAATGAA